MCTLGVSVAMSVSTLILRLNLSCTQAAAWVIERLSRVNLNVTQTFNLQWLPSGDNPKGGRTDQDAIAGGQVIIFLVRQGSAWATLLLHGEETQTWISISKPLTSQESANLATLIQSTLQSESRVQNDLQTLSSG